ncbi:hypothetical protein M758_10G081600 [Ceratodon purpureus]|uniref:Protein kinase domain-containing protein n=1 Tax=Ceratodon purpureus TaxID=3225 RepID=A0A8T0GKT4_CERPU|nr:hypothetical protein KC19_10G083000 [Ceratodon purpureus]KAG0603287.1 hypothetical protein M758_10G081600 [Ceratodon purpureus]
MWKWFLRLWLRVLRACVVLDLCALFTGRFCLSQALDISQLSWKEMAATSGSDPSCAMGGSGESEYFTAPASATTSSSFVSAVEEQIERSKAHWSTLVDQSEYSDDDEDCVAEVSNVKEFMELQRHPIWGTFFQAFSDNMGVWKKMGELVVGEMFAEGGQAQLFHVKVLWSDPRNIAIDQREGNQHVLKVFKKGTFLKQVKSLLPHGLLQFHALEQQNHMSLAPKVVVPRYYCRVHHGILLEDGRFAFLMKREDVDLRTLIESNMEARSDIRYGPFPNDVVGYIMYDVALGVNWLHHHDIVHRDLKASNVLVKDWNLPWSEWECYIADYECSVGVLGTGFFGAPEVLQACMDMDKKTRLRPEVKTRLRLEVFSRAADVYSYGMTCYEILTGKLPFEDLHRVIYNTHELKDLIINQHLRPNVPEYVEEWIRELLSRCWQHDPGARPTFDEILSVLSTNSVEARRIEDGLKKVYGKNFKRGLYAETLH